MMKRHGPAAGTLALLVLFCVALPGFGQPPDAPPAFGLVLTGGGSFGAFEAGAIHAWYTRWQHEHGGTPPPIRVIAGTSTGALIGPFVALGPDGVETVANLYRKINQGDILSPKLSVVLPFAAFSSWSSSAYSANPLKHILQRELPDTKLQRIKDQWPGLRLVVLGTNFGTGKPAPFTNSPDQMALGLSRFRDGVLASTISPLATPPVYIKSGSSTRAEPILDGGIHAVAPFQAFFDLAAQSPEVEITQLIVVSAYPAFPSDDSASVQKKYPAHPNFGDIGARMDATISESSISKEIALAWAAIELRKAGVTADQVKERTGFYIPKPPKELVVIAPVKRLGWNNLRFDPTEMGKMFTLGENASPQKLVP